MAYIQNVLVGLTYNQTVVVGMTYNQTVLVGMTYNQNHLGLNDIKSDVISWADI